MCYQGLSRNGCKSISKQLLNFEVIVVCVLEAWGIYSYQDSYQK